MKNNRDKNIDITKKSSDEIIGHLEYHHEFYSTHLKNERDILVWLPPSYETSHKKYPVIYMHDGQNLFNPITSYIGYDWKADETATDLIKKGLIREPIIVGINNTKDRIEEYNFFHRKGKLYAKFLIDELKPFIDGHYRTITNNQNTALIGSSMGGLISFQLFFSFPEIFGKAACLSNSFWADDGRVFDFIKHFDKLPVNADLYIDCGSKENELIDDYKKMADLLNKIGFDKNNRLMTYIAENAGHSEYDWAARFNLPLEFLFGKK